MVGYRAARGDGGEPGAAPAAQHAVDLVAMDQCAASAAPRGEAVGEHAQHRGKSLTIKLAVGPGAPDQREQLNLLPGLGIDFRRDLLRKDVKRRLWHDQPIKFAAT